MMSARQVVPRCKGVDGRDKKKVNKDVSSEFSHVTASDSRLSPALRGYCYRWSLLSTQCALWDFLLEHVKGCIRYSSRGGTASRVSRRIQVGIGSTYLFETRRSVGL